MKKYSSKVEWKTLLLILGCHLLWLAAGLLWTTAWWWAGILILPFATAFHSSLQHETIHGHPTRFPGINELIASLPFGAVFPYRRYKELHLRHHQDFNLTDPLEDPESYFWPLYRFQSMKPVMQWVFKINNTLAGRLSIGPGLTMAGFFRTELVRVWRDEPGVRAAWLIHGAGLLLVALIVTYIFSMPLWVYLCFVVYPAMSLISLRTYAEHQAAENVGARTAIVEANPVLALLYLNNNLHIVHHANPMVPWYELPSLYQQRKAQFLAANEGTLFHGYSDIFSRFAFTVKQPVDHPFLHRQTVAPK